MIYTAAFLLCMARVAAWMQSAPLVGDPGVPGRVRMFVAIFVAILIAPLKGPVPLTEVFVRLPGELLLGLLFGFAARIVFAGIEAGGQLIGLQLGLGFAGNFDPAAREEALPTRRIARTLGGLAFVATDGIEHGLRGLLVTPVLQHTNAATIAARLVDASAEVLVIGLRFSAPLLVATVTLNLAMALGSRAAPALNVFSVMLAGTLVLGGALLFATAPAFAHEIWLVAERTGIAGLRVLGR